MPGKDFLTRYIVHSRDEQTSTVRDCGFSVSIDGTSTDREQKRSHFDGENHPYPLRLTSSCHDASLSFSEYILWTQNKMINLMANRETKIVIRYRIEQKTYRVSKDSKQRNWNCKFLNNSEINETNLADDLVLGEETQILHLDTSTRRRMLVGKARKTRLWRKEHEEEKRLSRSDTLPVPDRFEIHARRSCDCESDCKVPLSDVPYRLFSPSYRTNGPIVMQMFADSPCSALCEATMPRQNRISYRNE